VETSDTVDVATTVDAKGQSCPMPILMAAKAAKELQPGQVMLLEATDNGSRSDVPAWVAQTGNELIDSRDDGTVLRFWVRKS
jgi:tRNA 2-thiouridine synthesizing protein A